MSKTYPNNFAAACNKTYGLFFNSETTLRSHLVRLKDAVQPAFPGIPVNAVKSTSVREEDLCKTELGNMSETSNLTVPTPLLFQNILTTLDTNLLWNKVKFIDRDPH